MRIPVIMVLPSQTALQESAAAAAAKAAAPSLESVSVPSWVTSDSSYHAGPLTTRGAQEALESLATSGPQAAKSFAVRGHVEVESVEELPEEADGQPLFADPHIAPFITCGGTPPVGTNATVATKLHVEGLGVDDVVA